MRSRRARVIAGLLVHLVALIEVFFWGVRRVHHVLPNSMDPVILPPVVVGALISGVTAGVLVRWLRGDRPKRRGHPTFAVLSVFAAVLCLSMVGVAFGAGSAVAAAAAATLLAGASAIGARAARWWYAGTILMTAVVVCASYLSASGAYSHVDETAQVNWALDSIQQHLDMEHDFVRAGGTLYTFDSVKNDPANRVFGYHHGWFTTQERLANGDFVIMFQHKRGGLSLSGSPLPDPRQCADSDIHPPIDTPPSGTPSLPQQQALAPVDPYRQSCVLVPGHQAKVVIKATSDGRIAYIDLYDDVSESRSLWLRVADPHTTIAGMPDYAEHLLGSVVTYDPYRWSAREIFDAAMKSPDWS